MHEIRFRAMGSDAHVVVVGDRGLLDEARRRVEDLEQKWSRFIDSSEISMLNRTRGVPVEVSADTFLLVRRALEGWRATGGRFDPTVLGDVIRAGYDRPFEAVVIRADGGVSTLQRNCGAIIADPATRAVTLPDDAGFDPGGIGKGLAADVVAVEMIVAGTEGVCVNIGGDLRTEGHAGAGDAWVIGVEHPLAPGEIARVALAAGAVATSGTRARAWMVGNGRRHHLIDPATGTSSQAGTVALTAIAREAAWAEVATKAAILSLPGWELDTLEELGCDGLLVGADGVVRTTHNFDRFTQRVPTS
jgi:thiamine biosynthesis lipoprotein